MFFYRIFSLHFIIKNICVVEEEKFLLRSLQNKPGVNQISEHYETFNKSELTHVTEMFRSKMRNSYWTYADIFLKWEESLIFSNRIKYRKQTTIQNPIYTKNYRYLLVHKTEVSKQINKLLNQGIIRNSISPWTSPIWVVPNKLDNIEFRNGILS